MFRFKRLQKKEFVFFRNKSGNWQGTVAGVLSSNCPRYFISGYQTLTEAGYWMAAEEKPPSHTEKQGLSHMNTLPMKVL